MPKIEIQGVGRFEVDDSFSRMTSEQQAAAVDEFVSVYTRSGAAPLSNQVPAKLSDIDPAMIEASKRNMAAARERAGVRKETLFHDLVANEYARSLLSQRDTAAAFRGLANSQTTPGGGLIGANLEAVQQAQARSSGGRSRLIDQLSANVREGRRDVTLAGPGPGEDLSYLVGRAGLPMLQNLALIGYGGLPAGVALGVAQGAGEEFAAAEDYGATPEEALQASASGAVVQGVGNVVPGMRFTPGATVMKQVGRSAVSAAVEGLQSGAQQLGTNVIRQQYNPDQTLAEGVLLAFGMGTGLRGAAEAPGLAAGVSRNIRDANVQRAADRIDLEAMQARTAAAEAAQAAEQAQRDAVSRTIAQQYQYEPGPTPRSQEPPIVRSSETDVFTDAQARADAVQQLQDQRVLEQQRAANRQVYPDEPGPALPSASYEPPRPPAPLTPQEQARLTRLNAERIIGGERPVTEEEFRAMGTSGPKEPTVVGAYSADNIIEPTMRMTEGGVVERVQPQAQEVQAPSQIQGQTEGVPAQVRQVEGAPQRVDQQLGTGEVRPGGVVDATTIRTQPEQVPITPQQQKNGGGLSKALRKFHNDERGAIVLSDLTDSAALAAKRIGMVASEVGQKVDYFSDSMKNRLNRAKTESGRELSNIAADIDRSYNEGRGRFKQQMRNIAKHVSRFGAPDEGSKLQRAASLPKRIARLSRLVTPEFEEGKSWAISKVASDTADRTIKPDGVVGDIAELHKEAAKFIKSKGLLQNKGGEVVEFVGAEDGRVWVRFFTRDMINVLAAGPSKNNPAFRQVVDAYIDANAGKVSPAVIEESFKRLSKAMGSQDGDSIRQINQEIARVIPVAPTHIKIQRPTGGTFILNALEVDPVRYSQRLVDRIASRTAWTDKFGQPELGKPGQYNVDELKARFVAEGNDQFLFDEFQAIGNGIPMDMIARQEIRSAIAPASKRAAATTYLDESIKTIKALMLTGSAPLNIPETLFGAPATHGGIRELLAAMGLRKGQFTKEDIQFANDFADLHTAQTYDIGSSAIDISQRLGYTGAMREVRDAMLTISGVKAINELQDRLAPRAAALKMRGWQKGIKRASDFAVLRSMGFDAETSRAMIKGQGSDADYARFIQDFAQFTVGSTPAPFTKSRADYNQSFKTLIAFSTYARRRFDQARKLAGLLAEATINRDAELFKSSAALAGRMGLGAGLQGGAMAMIMAYLSGGAEGVQQAVRDIEHDPTGSVVDFMQNALVGGPYMQLIDMFNNVGEDTTEGTLRRGATMTFPGSLTVEILDMWNGQGVYRDQNWTDKANTYFTRRIPGNRMLNNFVAAMGLSERDRTMELAVSNFYKWKRENDMPVSRTTVENEPEEAPQFRNAMRRVRQEIERGGDPAQAYAEAYSLRGADSVRRSLLASRTLESLTPEQQESLRKRIGDTQYEKLQIRDALLQAWADSVLDF